MQLHIGEWLRHLESKQIVVQVFTVGFIPHRKNTGIAITRLWVQCQAEKNKRVENVLKEKTEYENRKKLKMKDRR